MTTSRRHCSHQSIARSPSVSTSDHSCLHSSQWPLRKSESSCPACRPCRHHSMSCYAPYWSRALTCSYQPLPDSLTCHCRLESFLPDKRERRCSHCWRRPCSTVHSQRTTGGNTAPLATILSRRPDPVHQDGPARITCHCSRRGRPARVYARPSVVCSLLQPDRRCHRSLRRTVSPIGVRRRRAAPSRHACRQHTRRAVRSRRVYHDVRQWYLQNGLQLNPDKSEALIVGTTNQLRVVTSSVSSASMAGVDLPVADDIKLLGIVLDRHLSFHKHISAVARSCN